MAEKQKVVYDLSNGTISNDLALFSRSRHSLTLNISQTTQDSVIVTV